MKTVHAPVLVWSLLHGAGCGGILQVQCPLPCTGCIGVCPLSLLNRWPPARPIYLAAECLPQSKLTFCRVLTHMLLDCLNAGHCSCRQHWAVLGLSYSISCHAMSSGEARQGAKLQDILRLLTLWFSHGNAPDVEAALQEGFRHVSIDTWLVVIPQVDIDPCASTLTASA